MFAESDSDTELLVRDLAELADRALTDGDRQRCMELISKIYCRLDAELIFTLQYNSRRPLSGLSSRATRRGGNRRAVRLGAARHTPELSAG